MAHYIYCYYRVCGDKPGKTEVEFAVPTGACGNITGELDVCSSDAELWSKRWARSCVIPSIVAKECYDSGSHNLGAAFLPSL